jgi:hypothetical protein
VRVAGWGVSREENRAGVGQPLPVDGMGMGMGMDGDRGLHEETTRGSSEKAEPNGDDRDRPKLKPTNVWGRAGRCTSHNSKRRREHTAMHAESGCWWA